MLPRARCGAADGCFKRLGDTRAMPPDDLTVQALRAGASGTPAARAATRRRAIVAGGAGALGAAVLEELLASRVFGHVGVLVTQPLNAALRGLVAVTDGAPSAEEAEDTALIVFDRERHANGRDLAFLKPRPDDLSRLAVRLRGRGARHLVVVLPHAAASLPDALKRGLGNLDEQAVAALDFEHVVLMRPARPPEAQAARGALQRVAHGVLAQMRLMVPQREQPVRAAKVARFAVRIAEALPGAAPGTRVLSPEIVWQAAQGNGDPAAWARAWLHGEALPQVAARRMRL